MSHSQRLTFDDVRSVFRLVGEVCELGTSPSMWRSHMLERLCALVNATRAHAGKAPIPCSPVKPTFLGMMISGVSEPRLRGVYHGLIWERDYSDDPCAEVMATLIKGSFTRTRQQMAPDRAWYRRRDLDAWRTLGADSFVYSHQVLPAQGCLHLIALNRPWGKPAFAERERRIVDLFHNELGRLWRERPHDPAARLSPRVRQVLDLLAEGHTEQEIAATLEIARNTVHQYVKGIYRRYDVCSHAKLMAQLQRDRLQRSPRLSSSS